LLQARENAAALIAERKQIERQQRELSNAVLRWASQAEKALQHDREDLARQALATKHDKQKEVDRLATELEQVNEQLEKLTQDIATLQHQRAQSCARERELHRREQTAQQQLAVRATTSRDATLKVQARYQQFEAKVEALEAKVEAYDLGQSNHSVAAQFAELERQDAIDHELAALRQRLSA